jgi:hypothetical protein
MASETGMNAKPGGMEKLAELEAATKQSPTLIESLKANPYFGAGFGLVVMGAGLSMLKKSTAVAYTLAQKNLTVSLDVVSKDKSYVWILRWINQHLKQRAQHINVDTFFQASIFLWRSFFFRLRFFFSVHVFFLAHITFNWHSYILI